MVTGASTGPNEKSASLTGGKGEVESGADVGSALIAEQLIAGVGVSIMTGFSTITVVGEATAVPDEQAPNMNVTAMNNKRLRVRFIVRIIILLSLYSFL
jgi:hypothetical protein